MLLSCCRFQKSIVLLRRWHVCVELLLVSAFYYLRFSSLFSFFIACVVVVVVVIVIIVRFKLLSATKQHNISTHSNADHVSNCYFQSQKKQYKQLTTIGTLSLSNLLSEHIWVIFNILAKRYRFIFHKAKWMPIIPPKSAVWMNIIIPPIRIFTWKLKAQKDTVWHQFPFTDSERISGGSVLLRMN